MTKNTSQNNVNDLGKFVVDALNSSLFAGKPEAIYDYFAPDYVNHNPDVADGPEPLAGLAAKLAPVGGLHAEIMRVLVDGDLVALHSKYEGIGPNPLVGFDVFRMGDNNMLVEHWDNLTDETAPNPSGHTQLDGPTDITDLERTDANKVTVKSFLTRVLIDGEDLDLTKFINPTSYIQHNSQVADGLEGYGAFMAQMAQQGQTMTYSKLHKIMGQGNFVLAMSVGAIGGEPQAFYDLFRLENGLIVEHWDVITPMPDPDAATNNSGKF